MLFAVLLSESTSLSSPGYSVTVGDFNNDGMEGKNRRGSITLQVWSVRILPLASGHEGTFLIIIMEHNSISQFILF